MSDFWNSIPDNLFDDMKPREVTAVELQKQIVETYDWYRLTAYSIEMDDEVVEERSLRWAECNGAAEALSAIYLYFFGGRAMLELDRIVVERMQKMQNGEGDS